MSQTSSAMRTGPSKLLEAYPIPSTIEKLVEVAGGSGSGVAGDGAALGRYTMKGDRVKSDVATVAAEGREEQIRGRVTRVPAQRDPSDPSLPDSFDGGACEFC